MKDKLDHIKLKLQALGFSIPQINSIIERTLSGKQWEGMRPSEQCLALDSLGAMISFYRGFVKAFCGSCSISKN